MGAARPGMVGSIYKWRLPLAGMRTELLRMLSENGASEIRYDLDRYGKEARAFGVKGAGSLFLDDFSQQQCLILMTMNFESFPMTRK